MHSLKVLGNTAEHCACFFPQNVWYLFSQKNKCWIWHLALCCKSSLLGKVFSPLIVLLKSLLLKGKCTRSSTNLME